MYKIVIVSCLAVVMAGCTDDQIVPTTECIEATVIGPIRTAGGGLAVSLSEPIKGAINWKNEENVVELLNIPVEFTFAGTVIYFKGREAKEGERGPVSADGDESIQLVLYGSEFSNVGCQEVR